MSSWSDAGAVDCDNRVAEHLGTREGTSGQLSVFQKLRTQSRSYYGMQLAHIGVAVFIVGVTIVTGYQSEQDVRMDVGDTVNAGGYTFRFNGVTNVVGPNYRAARAEIEVIKNGKVVQKMYPEKRSYIASENVMTETAIDTGLFRDLYISLGEPVSGGAWSVRVYFKPFVSWIWGGAVLMALGGASRSAIGVMRWRRESSARIRKLTTDRRESGYRSWRLTVETYGTRKK